MLSYSASALKMRKGFKKTTGAFLLSWFCCGEGKQNPLKYGRRIQERGHMASKKSLLPFHSMLNTFALMAPHLQLSDSLCARSSSCQRSRWWLFCPSLLQTWAWHCLLRTWWCLQSSSGTQGYASWRGQGLDAPWTAETLVLRERCNRQGNFSRVFLFLSLTATCLFTPRCWGLSQWVWLHSLLPGEYDVKGKHASVS